MYLHSGVDAAADPVAALSRFNEALTPALYVFGVAALVLETLAMRKLRPDRDKRSRWLGIKCGALAFGAAGLFHATALYAAQLWVYEHRALDLGFGVIAFGVCFVVNDLMFYLSHRHQHEVRALWAVHVVHHSPRHYDLTTGVRGSVLGALVTAPYVLWIPLLGIHPMVFLVVDTAFKFYGLAYHTEAIDKLGWLERWLITPSHHRVHHATNPQYLDRNYGGFFVLFDRLFGTFAPEVEPPRYGLTKDWHGYGVWDCQVHELRDLLGDVSRTPRWADKVRYLLKPPGWSPEGGVPRTDVVGAGSDGASAPFA